MTDTLTPGRQLLTELVDMPELLEGLSHDTDLLTVGINSGELIRIALAVEERTGVALDDEEMTRLYTIDGIDEILAGAATAGVSD